MSFKSRDLMVDVLPATKPFAIAGLVLCGEVTAGGNLPGSDDDDEEPPAPCGDATANPDPFSRPELGLAMLRQQLREALALEQAPRS